MRLVQSIPHVGHMEHNEVSCQDTQTHIRSGIVYPLTHIGTPGIEQNMQNRAPKSLTDRNIGGDFTELPFDNGHVIGLTTTGCSDYE
jgi:hypothetical protein